MNQTLSDWYLARLRRLAWQQNAVDKPTPMTLVQTDKELLQQLVSRTSESQEHRRKRFEEQILKSASNNSELLTVGISCAGVLAILLSMMF